MEYAPEAVQRKGIGERASNEAQSLTGPAIIRRLRVTEWLVERNSLFLAIDPLPFPLALAQDAVMTFGTESITAVEYCRRVIEDNDLIDAVVTPLKDGAFPIQMFWIHINYVDTPSMTGAFSRKDDGLFAMRAKAGEKAERIVTRQLRDDYGHRFPDGLCDSPGVFEIRYAGKKIRKPDRRCLNCGLTVEVKKRNKDKHLRVSHSSSRPFASENPDQGWHAFVFPDMNPRFLPNTAISQAIAKGRCTLGNDRYDAWADVDGLQLSTPPHCSR